MPLMDQHEPARARHSAVFSCLWFMVVAAAGVSKCERERERRSLPLLLFFVWKADRARPRQREEKPRQPAIKPLERQNSPSKVFVSKSSRHKKPKTTNWYSARRVAVAPPSLSSHVVHARSHPGGRKRHTYKRTHARHTRYWSVDWCVRHRGEREIKQNTTERVRPRTLTKLCILRNFFASLPECVTR